MFSISVSLLKSVRYYKVFGTISISVSICIVSRNTGDNDVIKLGLLLLSTVSVADAML